MTKSLSCAVVILSITVMSFGAFTPHAKAQFEVYDPINWIENTITSIDSVTTAAAGVAQQIKTYVLDPIAFVMSGNALRAITAGVVDFVNGKSNGSGAPQFVRDLRGFQRSVRDAQAFAFLAGINRTGSPFANAIQSSLRLNYLQGTSAAGFWAANQCTLNGASPDINTFLVGNFSQGGGWGAWFALTTEPQNNPYLLYYRSQAQLYNATEDAVVSQLRELDWGQGFLSWCGEAPDSALPDSIDVTGRVTDSGPTTDADGNFIITVDSGAIDTANNYLSDQLQSQTDAAYQASNGRCPDGSKVETPGSVIHDALSKALGSDIDKLVGVGTQGEISNIFKNLASILQTVGYGQAIFGSSGSKGLYGFTPTVGSGYLGGTAASYNARGATIPQTWQEMQQQQKQVQAQTQQPQTQTTQSGFPTSQSPQAGLFGIQQQPTQGQ